MKSKRTRLLIVCCILWVILIALWLYRTTPQTLTSTAPQSSVQTSVSQTAPLPAVTTLSSTTNAPVDMKAAIQQERAREMAFWKNMFSTSILFYGKIIDQKKNPVEGAKAVIEADDYSMGPGKKYIKISDQNGLFSISGVHGLGLTIAVSKDGYYIIHESYGNFGYAPGTGESPPHNDPNDPAIFVLRKMGKTEPLIVHNISAKINRIGTPVPMDLSMGDYGVSKPDVQIQSWTYDQDIKPGIYKSYDWRCKITVPDGGIQQRTGDEFDFIAPEDGYQPSDEINMPANTPQWRASVSRSYFLKLANGDYARIDFTMGAGGYNTFEITTYLNPKPGHRNLEYDPAKQINK